MKATGVVGMIAALVLLSGVTTARSGPTEFDFGKQEYETRCASCHGVDAKGNGPHKPYLDKSPTDLTVLARNNGGEFPYSHFFVVVEGRFERGRDMPCFADVFKASAAQDYMEVPYDPDRYLDTRLTAMADYLVHLQVK